MAAGSVPQAETIQRGDFEMVANGEIAPSPARRPNLRNDCKTGAVGPGRRLRKALAFARANNLRRTQPLRVRPASALRRRTSVVLKSPVVKIDERQAERFARWRMNRRQKIVALGHQHPLVEVRSGAEDLRHFPFDELPGRASSI